MIIRGLLLTYSPIELKGNSSVLYLARDFRCLFQIYYLEESLWQLLHDDRTHLAGNGKRKTAIWTITHKLLCFPSHGAGTTRKLFPVSGSYWRLELNDVVKIHRGYSMEDPKSLARSPRPNVRPPPWPDRRVFWLAKCCRACSCAIESSYLRYRGTWARSFKK